MKDDEFYKQKSIESLKQASVWVIEEGIRTFSQRGKEAIFKKLIDEWGVQLWVDPWVETDVYLARFAVKARGINYEILNLDRTKIGANLYEFWIVKVTAVEWSGESDRTMFYVTKTDSVYGKREILTSSDQFIQSYTVDSENTIEFPVNDSKILFDMQAWLFPKNYKSSNLKNIEAIMKEDGEIELMHRQ
ncbi:hypothetical protein [Microbulbifer sp. TYP-18]|uniref:hypothetical protein n=1 Tax=Microbulbifer sp. TYP-18 TaxID=3230024 RepID=UPI0034C5BEDC